MLLELKRVSAFYGDLQALHEVSLEIREGEIVALVGSNGAGKSTTLRTISGLVRAAGASEIWFEGRRIDRLPAYEIAGAGIIHVPEGRRLFPFLSVEDNLRVGAFSARVRRNTEKNLARVFELMPILKERRNQLAGTLSGGEQQMCAIARGLMVEPRLLMLDEPSLGLSPLFVDTVFELIQQINRQGTTVLLVEQNVEKSLRLARRGYVLDNGKVVLSGPGEELLNNEDVRKAYLTVV